MRTYKFYLMATVFLALTLAAAYRAGGAAGSIYVVAAESALLRDYPSPDSGIVMKLGQADQVEYLDSNAHGWWKVKALRTGATGWMTADLLSAAAPKPLPASPKTQFYYLTVPSVELKILPLETSATTGTVQLNDRLEKLGAAPSGWTKVKNPRTEKTGWLLTRYLSSQMVTAPQAAAAKKKMSRKCPVKKKKRVKPATEEIEEQAQPM